MGMTFVMSLRTQHTIWMVADRRLHWSARKFTDDACKIMELQTSDGTVLFGYAGLGATAKMQPSTWMANTLRGRAYTLEGALGTLALAAERELPPYLKSFHSDFSPVHTIIAPAFNQGKQKQYAIETDLRRVGTKTILIQHEGEAAPGVIRPFSIVSAGSGQNLAFSDKSNLAIIRRLLKAYDKGRVPGECVAKELAKLNYFVHKGTQNGTVGDRCVVVWRHNDACVRKGCTHDNGGTMCFVGTSQDDIPVTVPTIACGYDVQSIAGVMVPYMLERFEARNLGKDEDSIMERMNLEIAELPTDPDDKLR